MGGGAVDASCAPTALRACLARAPSSTRSRAAPGVRATTTHRANAGLTMYVMRLTTLLVKINKISMKTYEK